MDLWQKRKLMEFVICLVIGMILVCVAYYVFGFLHDMFDHIDGGSVLMLCFFSFLGGIIVGCMAAGNKPRN